MNYLFHDTAPERLIPFKGAYIEQFPSEQRGYITTFQRIVNDTSAILRIVLGFTLMKEISNEIERGFKEGQMK